MRLLLLCTSLGASQGYMLISSWLAQRMQAAQSCRSELPSMGFFDAFKDPSEFELVQAQEALDRAEASSTATVSEIKAARVRLADATAAAGKQQRKAAGSSA